MNKQKVFKQVVTHLIRQGKRSLSHLHSLQCRYRGIDGTKCAIGCLITDEAYSMELEGHTIDYFDVQAAVERSGIELKLNDEEFLRDLQEVHDRAAFPIQEWPFYLLSVGEAHGLNTKFIDNLEMVCG